MTFSTVKAAAHELFLRLMHRRGAYRSCFNSTPGKMVLKDLARFCHAHDSTFDEDPRVHAMLEGRREVWLRIQLHLQLDDDTLWEMFSGRSRDDK